MPGLHLYSTNAIHSQFEILNLKEKARVNYVAHDVEKKPQKTYEWRIVWRNVIVFTVLHLLAFYGLFQIIAQRKLGLWLFVYGYGMLIAQGITAGAHRLWAHKSYKAKLPLRILLLFFQTSCFQNSVYEWVRDHRVHHKFTETDADPHNSTRGFFFSHVGWLLLRKENEVKEKGKDIDMSDLKSDPLLMWQHKYYFPLMLICSFVIPPLIPWYFWNEEYWLSFTTAGTLRWIWSVHTTWLVNSAAHIYGSKPYDRGIGPAENIMVSLLTGGEGFHNYHHVFPWDYKTSELGRYLPNCTLAFINFFSVIGWAYDLKTVPKDMVLRRIKRTGDGSWPQLKNGHYQEISQEDVLVRDKDYKKEYC